MTDCIPTEPGPAAPFGLLNELLSLRAELAEAKESLRLSAQGLHTYVEALNTGNAALAAKDARIAELENKNSYNLQIVREATARIAELEQQAEFHVKMLTGGGSAAYLGELTEANARIAELEGLLAYATDTDAYRRIRARAERAEAELDISREAHRMVQSALLSQAAETERAEAERDALREALVIARQWMPVHPIEDAARRECAIVDTALAPSPAGREG